MNQPRSALLLPSAADPRPPQRIRNPELLRNLHVYWRGECVLGDLGDCVPRFYSLHHVHKHPRDDEQANLVMLCGDGVRGHHGQIEAGAEPARRALGAYLVEARPDTIEYLRGKLGDEQALEWLRRYLFAPV